MTAVSTIISIKGIAFASDSFLTKKSGQHQIIVESQIGKIVRYEKIRSACVYWGLAKKNSWDAKNWLKSKQNIASQKNLPNFANYLANELQKLNLSNGFGIHLSGYEYVAQSGFPKVI